MRDCWLIGAAAHARSRTSARGFAGHPLSWKANPGSKPRLAGTWPSCAARMLPWLEQANAEMSYWESNKQGLRACIRLRLAVPLPPRQETQTQRQTAGHHAQCGETWHWHVLDGHAQIIGRPGTEFAMEDGHGVTAWCYAGLWPTLYVCSEEGYRWGHVRAVSGDASVPPFLLQERRSQK